MELDRLESQPNKLLQTSRVKKKVALNFIFFLDDIIRKTKANFIFFLPKSSFFYLKHMGTIMFQEEEERKRKGRGKEEERKRKEIDEVRRIFAQFVLKFHNTKLEKNFRSFNNLIKLLKQYIVFIINRLQLDYLEKLNVQELRLDDDTELVSCSETEQIEWLQNVQNSYRTTFQKS
ncbi:hypothetical protein BpHYR1_040128 [Brachionus plicatilis]|uniref:Uncharacterized protein n=1 Tax=Brachionus plicatilis TaxID=10195 RepID=A0A3M7RBN5_BRAPC|nr:hypothetical protein BpHYR1_040128 [Brachionus plicatilis]